MRPESPLVSQDSPACASLVVARFQVVQSELPSPVARCISGSICLDRRNTAVINGHNNLEICSTGWFVSMRPNKAQSVSGLRLLDTAFAGQFRQGGKPAASRVAFNFLYRGQYRANKERLQHGGPSVCRGIPVTPLRHWPKGSQIAAIQSALTVGRRQVRIKSSLGVPPR
jgi:hypothetical protein